MGRIRRNNLQGHDRKYIKHGHLTSRKTLRNLGFNEVPDLTEEERRRELSEKLKPYKLDLSKHIPIEAKGPVGEEPVPSPTPTPSITPSVTPTITPTMTQTITPTPSFTPTLTPTPSATPPALGQLLVLAGPAGSTGQKSYDGVNWSGVTYSLGANQHLAYSDTLGIWVAADGRRNSLNKYSYSYSGDTWTQSGPASGNRVSDLKWLDYAGIFISTPNESSQAYYSYDGINWNLQTWPTVGGSDQFLMVVDEGRNQFVAIREDGDIFTSYSGTSLTLRDGSTFSTATIPHYNATLDRYVAVNRDFSTIAYSDDGALTWTTTSSPISGTSSQIWSSNSITSRPDGLMLAVSFVNTNGMISTDGINWSATTLPATASYYLAVEYVPDISLFVLMNRAGDIWTSPDATTWTSRTKSSTMDVFTIKYGYIK